MMIVLTIVFVILFVTLIVKKDKKNIGIFRAIGLTISSINYLYIFTLTGILILSIIMLFIGTYLGNLLCENILINSFLSFHGLEEIPGMQFLPFNFASTSIFALLIVLFIVLSLIIPYVMIKRNKPIEIIRNND